MNTVKFLSIATHTQPKHHPDPQLGFIALQ